MRKLASHLFVPVHAWCTRMTGRVLQTNEGAGQVLAREADALEFERTVKVQARTADDPDAIARD